MKRVIHILCVFLIGTCLHAYAGMPGSSCTDAIPMGTDYRADVRNGQTIWYSAWTFDLPLTVTFAPENGADDPAPEVEMDFTCISGYYADSILCSLFCKTSGSSGIDMGLPHKPNLNSGTQDDGTFVYYLSLGKKYRDLLLQFGISYNVEVYVKVTYKSNGTISLAPDDLFSNCVDKAKFIRYGDTVLLAANDTNRHVIFPFLQWQEDTVIYKWTGTEPCEVVVANTCKFFVYDHNDGNIIDRKEIAPGDSVRVKATEIYDWVHNEVFKSEAGMYFAKIQSDAPGVLTVVKAAQAAPDGHATLLRYDKTYPLDANSKDVYAIPRSWDGNVMFTASTSHLFTMVFSKTAAFGASDTLKVYSFDKTENGRWKGVSSEDMKACWNQIPISQQYMYIRFICTEATTVTPERWRVSECFTKTLNTAVSPGQTFLIDKGSSKVYRFSYVQWVRGDMTISFSLSSACNVYLANTCNMNTSRSDADYWIRYKQAVKSSQPLVIPKEEIVGWADKIDEEGNFYAIFNSNAISTNRKITVTTSATPEVDPTYPASSIAVACDEHNQVYVIVKQKQTIIIKNEAGVDVKTIPDAQPDTKYSLAELPAGKYSLQAENETIEIQL